MTEFIKEIRERIDFSSDDWKVHFGTMIIFPDRTGYDAMTVVDLNIQHINKTDDKVLTIDCTDEFDYELYSLKWFVELIEANRDKEVIFNILGENDNIIKFKYDNFDIGHSDKTVLISLK